MHVTYMYPSIVLRETVPCRYQPFCRSLVACWTARNSDAVPCFCQPSSVNLALNAVKLPWFLLKQTKHLTSVGDIHDPAHWHVAPRFMSQRHSSAPSETAPCRFTSLFFCRSLVARWTAGNSDALVCFCQPSSLDLTLNAVKLRCFYVEASNTASQTFDLHVSCHNTASWTIAGQPTAPRGELHTKQWHEQAQKQIQVPIWLCVCGKPWNKG